ncbi:hypothetical protein BJ508DRAFT_301497 [Ascobolus immersus RN42]|uniref:Uncharacterized protein n=1 Tax=Ascobolus immersus RN42 TaxID=1160509 RepID=A0A3N4IPL6_ASCIM|nr:hypothetical protein BJ508DRAFT_301497 [Ascobolus immersus RN42]
MEGRSIAQFIASLPAADGEPIKTLEKDENTNKLTHHSATYKVANGEEVPASSSSTGDCSKHYHVHVAFAVPAIITSTIDGSDIQAQAHRRLPHGEIACEYLPCKLKRDPGEDEGVTCDGSCLLDDPNHPGEKLENCPIAACPEYPTMAMWRMPLKRALQGIEPSMTRTAELESDAKEPEATEGFDLEDASG